MEIKAQDLLEEATAKLISQAGKDKELTSVLINFSFEKSANDKSWDIEYDLNNISKLLLNENHFEQINELHEKSLVDFENLKKEIGGQDGPEPTRFGDWEKKGITSDF